MTNKVSKRTPAKRSARPPKEQRPKRPAEREVARATTKASFVSLLRRVADALEQEQTVSVSVRGHRVRLPREVGFAVEYEGSDGEHELEFQVSWKDA